MSFGTWSLLVKVDLQKELFGWQEKYVYYDSIMMNLFNLRFVIF
jgi:hypothetical protein